MDEIGYPTPAIAGLSAQAGTSAILLAKAGTPKGMQAKGPARAETPARVGKLASTGRQNQQGG